MTAFQAVGQGSNPCTRSKILKGEAFLKIKGFPDIVSDKIELPNMGELLHMQFTHLCEIDDFYKHGCEFQRMLVDKTPLLGKASRTGVIFAVQYMYPGMSPLVERRGVIQEWHIDYDIEQEDPTYRSHLLLSECQAMTEYNDHEFEINEKELNIKTTSDLNYFFTDHPELLVPKPVEANRIYTFEDHPHRAVLATKPQLRFIYRVVETEKAKVAPWEKAKSDSSSVGFGNELYPTLRKTPNRIILDFEKWDEHFYEKHYDAEGKNERYRKP